MRHRWHHGGGNGNFPFNSEAVGLVARYSHGIPRVMNAICDIALLRAYTAETPAIGPETVREALGVLELDEPLPDLKAAAGLSFDPLRLPTLTAQENDGAVPMRIAENKPATAARTGWWSSIFPAARSKA
jgi:hypothetical protein